MRDINGYNVFLSRVFILFLFLSILFYIYINCLAHGRIRFSSQHLFFLINKLLINKVLMYFLFLNQHKSYIIVFLYKCLLARYPDFVSFNLHRHTGFKFRTISYMIRSENTISCHVLRKQTALTRK